MDLTGRLALEAIQREAIKILYANLNDKLDEMYLTWQDEDYDFFLSLDKGNIEWSVEKINSENFYSGIIPSLINAETDKYPNISAICHQATPIGSSDDTADGYFCRLNIEIMVKSSNEEEVNTRCNKTMDAAHLVLLENRNLNKLVSHITGPKASLGEVFVLRSEPRGTGERIFWQGGLLEYDVYKYVNLV